MADGRRDDLRRRLVYLDRAMVRLRRKLAQMERRRALLVVELDRTRQDS